MAAYKVLGINDEVTVCECCGRANLKKTVILSNGEGEVRYGTECAARAMGRSKQDVEKDVRAAGAMAREEVKFQTWLKGQQASARPAEFWRRYYQTITGRKLAAV